MDISIQMVEGVTVAEMAGELDGLTAPRAQADLLPLAGPNCSLLLDMGGLSYMSSAGLRVLLTLSRTAARNNGRVAVSAPSEYIRDTMAMTGFLAFLPVYESRAAALMALRQPA